METVLIRINSQRAFDKFKKLGIPYNSLSTFTNGYFYGIETANFSKAIGITGISKARKPQCQMFLCWNTKEAFKSNYN